MAAKKIGAIIALDGEKSFKQAVTNCSTSLRNLKSEMELVETEAEGQENSLESLQKKHTVLGKILDEQKAKENAISDALENARKNYDKVGDGIKELTGIQEQQKKKVDELKDAYKEATRRLEEMNDSGDASEQELKDLKDALSALSKELELEEQNLKAVNDALKKGERNYQTAEDRVKKWETNLNEARVETVKAGKALDETTKYLKEAEKSADGTAKTIDEYGRRVQEAQTVTLDFAEVLKVNLANTVAESVKGMATATATAFLDMEGAQQQFQASTGASTEEMREYNSVMSELYKNNYGDGINDIAEAMALVKQYTGELDPGKLEEMTENGIAMRDVFGMDLSETIRGVDALIDNMGLTSEQAFDLIATGAQNGLDKSGELTDNIAEYSQLWAQAGFSAEEMFTILQNGLDSGAYNLDKVNDFVKEFTISLADGRIEDNLESFSSETQNLFKSWQEGKTTSKQVFYSVVNDLANATNKQEALTIASNTWSSLGEDNALTVITALDDVNDTYKNVQGTMEEIKDIKYDTLESRYEQLGRTFMTEVGQPIAEKALPLMEDGLEMVIDNMDTLLALAAGAGAAFATYQVATTAITVMTGATEGATAATTILNAVCNANPFVLLATVVVGAGTALLTYADNAGQASQEVQILVEENQRVVDSANEVAKSLDDSISAYADNAAEIEAQGQYAKILADRIETLAGKSKLTSSEMSVLQGYIAELNGIVPDLNLAYDEQADKLNMSTEAIYNNIDANQAQIEQQAAMEYAVELIKKKTELEIEGIKLENELNDVTERRNELLDDENVLAYQSFEPLSAMIKGVSDEREEYQQLTEAQKANQEAIETNNQAKEDLIAQEEAVKEKLEEMGISWGEATAAVDTNAEATQNAAAAATTASEETSAAIQKITENYQESVTSISEIVNSQMDMFAKFDASVDLSTTDLLANMQSQIDGVSNWATNIQVLADRGINQGLLGYLAEMGPQGAGYVALFAQMSDTELEKANSMWAESMTLKESVSSEVADAMTGYSQALQASTPQATAVAEATGDEISGALGTGYTNGIEGAATDAVGAMNTLTDATKKAAEESLQIHSPSKVFEGYGGRLPEGLAIGIRQETATANRAVTDMVSYIQSTATGRLNTATYRNVGYQIPAGMASGILSGQSMVINAVAQVCAAAEQSARNRLQIHSPSRVFESLGEYTAEGYGEGYLKRMGVVRDMITQSMDFDAFRPDSAAPSGGGIDTYGNSGKIVIQMPIYVGKTYKKTEIVEIARNGISNMQRNYYRAKGVVAGV